jgi:2-succinyl-6-hydroxy-2,4-cyclohexadiene-1-carboxylate synthase
LTLVLLHGFLGRPAAWDEVRARLGERDAAVPELPGHGPAPFVPETGSFADAIDAFAARLPAGPWVLAGYSMGGRIAVALAARHPRRVRGLLLVGADVGLESDAARADRERWDEAQAQALEREGLDGFTRAWEALPLFASQLGVSCEALTRQRSWRLQHEAPALAWAMRTLGLANMPAYRGALVSLDAPVRFLTGALDSKFTGLARELAPRLPRARHRVIDGAGHNLLLERPDAVAAELTALLEEA